MQLESVESVSNGAASSPSIAKTKPARKKAKRKPAAKKAKAASSRKGKAKRAAKSSGAKGKGGKTSFVIWVDAKQGAYIKAKAKKAGLSQADYFRRALKLPTSKK